MTTRLAKAVLLARTWGTIGSLSAALLACAADAAGDSTDGSPPGGSNGSGGRGVSALVGHPSCCPDRAACRRKWNQWARFVHRS